MPFNVQNLNLCSYSTNSSAPAIYTYSSNEDPLSVIIGSGYFGSIPGEFTVNDIIYIADNSGLQSGKGLYTVVSIDTGNKRLNLAPLISQSGAVSKWENITTSVNDNPPPSSIDKIAKPNMGYRVIPTGPDGEFMDVYIYLPSVLNLNAGDTIMVNNTSKAKVYLRQNVAQAVEFPDGQTTTRGVVGWVLSDNVGDSFTLVVAYNNTDITDSNYGTTFNLLNSTGVLLIR